LEESIVIHACGEVVKVVSNYPRQEWHWSIKNIKELVGDNAYTCLHPLKRENEQL